MAVQSRPRQVVPPALRLVDAFVIPLPSLTAKSAWRERLANAAPLTLSILLASTVFWMPFQRTTASVFAVAMLLFCVYWTLRSYAVAVVCLLGTRRIARWRQIDWRARYTGWASTHAAAPAWDWPRHLVVIPNYKEDEAELKRTLASLAAQPNAHQIIVVLAMEEREPGAEGKATRVLLAFHGQFADLFATYHPAGITGEAPGKGSNEAWGVRTSYRRIIEGRNEDIGRYTVTSCDADSVFSPHHFTVLNYLFLTGVDRYRTFWQPTVFNTNNIWDIPAPLRILDGLSGIFRMATLMLPGNVRFPTSCYTLAWRMLHEVDYWDEEVIPEDWHVYMKCSFALGDRVRVEPMFVLLGNDCVNTDSMVKTMRARYLQAVRHAWGASDIPYAWRATWNGGPLSFPRRFLLAFTLTKTHVLWAGQWFLVTLGVMVPSVLSSRLGASMPDWWMARSFQVPGVNIKLDALADPARWLEAGALAEPLVRVNLPGLLLALCFFPLAVMVVTEYHMRGPRPDYVSRSGLVRSFLVWLLMAPVTFFWACLPALHAQARLASGSGLVYRVAEKGNREAVAHHEVAAGAVPDVGLVTAVRHEDTTLDDVRSFGN